MSHKIIKPEGIELIEYLNNGYAICNRCGVVMRQTEDPKTGCGIYICPSCGLKMDEEDYEYESDEEVEWTEEMLDMEQGDIPPAGCRACGGPYPYCKRHVSYLMTKNIIERRSMLRHRLFLFGE